MMKLFLSFLAVCSSILYVNGNGELRILHAPDALEFHKYKTLLNSRLPDVFCVALGLTSEVNYSWDGVEIRKPTKFAKALIVIQFPGVKSLNTKDGYDYKLVTDENIEQVMNTVGIRTAKRFGPRVSVQEVLIDGGAPRPKVGEIYNKGFFELLRTETKDKETDNLFIDYLNKIHQAIVQVTVEKQKNVPNIFWISFPKMAEVLSQRKADSDEILLQALKMLTIEIRKTYSDQILVAAICESESEIRTKRQVEESEIQNTTRITLESLNVATDYDENFPVIFNIILWFSIGLLFALIAICMIIAGMDPGRDSIIYRMTSTRMKKDN